MSTPSTEPAAFRGLRRALLRRRLAQLDPRVRGEIALLALGVNAFLFWQARVPLDGWHRAGGDPAVLRALAVPLGLLVASAGVRIGVAHARALARRLPGPAWLALPVAPRALVAQAAWQARLGAFWEAAAAPGFLLAAHGLLPVWAIALLALLFALALTAAVRAGTWAAERIARLARPRGRIADAVLERLAEPLRPEGRARCAPPQWQRAPQPLVLWRKDRRLAVRRGEPRGAALSPLVLAFVSAAVWWVGLEPPAAYALAFGLALLAAAALAEFLVVLGGADPPAVLRPLPVGPGALWLGRALWVALAVALLVALHAPSARPLAAGPRLLLLAGLAGAGSAIGLLGVHYGLTLGPRVQAGRRFLTLTLAIAMAASLMIPLLGWLVLVGAVLHSARRVPRWARLGGPEE